MANGGRQAQMDAACGALRGEQREGRRWRRRRWRRSEWSGSVREVRGCSRARARPEAAALRPRNWRPRRPPCAPHRQNCNGLHGKRTIRASKVPPRSGVGICNVECRTAAPYCTVARALGHDANRGLSSPAMHTVSVQLLRKMSMRAARLRSVGATPSIHGWAANGMCARPACARQHARK